MLLSIEAIFSLIGILVNLPAAVYVVWKLFALRQAIDVESQVSHHSYKFERN